MIGALFPIKRCSPSTTLWKFEPLVELHTCLEAPESIHQDKVLSCTTLKLVFIEEIFKEEFSFKIARLPWVEGSLLVEAWSLPFTFFCLFLKTKQFFFWCLGLPHSQHTFSVFKTIAFPFEESIFFLYSSEWVGLPSAAMLMVPTLGSHPSDSLESLC